MQIKKILLLLFSLLILFGCNQEFKEGQIIEVVGTLKMVGNVPFSELVLDVGEEKYLYLIITDLTKYQSLQYHQGKKAFVRGRFHKKESLTADHKYELIRYELRDLEHFKLLKQ